MSSLLSFPPELLVMVAEALADDNYQHKDLPSNISSGKSRPTRSMNLRNINSFQQTCVYLWSLLRPFLYVRGARRNNGWMTGYHYAVHLGNVEAVRYFMELGADPNDCLGTPGHLSPLYLAASAGHAHLLEILFNAGAKVEEKCYPDQQGQPTSALIKAVCNGHDNAARVLLEAGTNPNVGPVLHMAVMSVHPTLVSLLLDFRANPNGTSCERHTALHCIVSCCQKMTAVKKRQEMVRILAARGGDLSSRCAGQTAVHVACHKGDVGILEVLLELCPQLAVIKSPVGDTPLHVAVNSRYQRMYIWHGPPDDYADQFGLHGTPLESTLGGEQSDTLLTYQSGTMVYANCTAPPCRYKKFVDQLDIIRMAELLVSRGADINASGSRGYTPLLNFLSFVADPRPRFRGEVIVRWLLDNGAHIDPAPTGRVLRPVGRRRTTALHLAASLDDNVVGELCIKELLKNVSDEELEVRNGSGETALHVAARHGSAEMIEQLLKRGSHLEAKSATGQMALHLATNRKREGAANAVLRTLLRYQEMYDSLKVTGYVQVGRRM